jgi:hypothetical protein
LICEKERIKNSFCFICSERERERLEKTSAFLYSIVGLFVSSEKGAEKDQLKKKSRETTTTK